MRFTIVTVAAISFASLASAQTTARVFDFTNKPSQQGLQEVATILRTVANIKKLSVDPAAATVTVDGTPDDLATSAWIIHQLDQPVPGSEPYVMPEKSDDVMRVFHLNHVNSATPQQIQEILTILRTVADIQKVFNDTALSDLVVRGTASQLALADYLIKSVDVAPGTVTTSEDFHYTAPPPNPRGSEVVRVFYLTHTTTPQQLQEILTTLRTVADIQKVFNYTPLNALAIRGSESDLATCEFLIGALDVASDAKSRPSGAHEFNIPANVPGGNVIGVYYPANIAGKDLTSTLTLLRSNLQIAKAFMKTAPATLIYRGSADQTAKAEQLIKDKDQPAESSSTAALSTR